MDSAMAVGNHPVLSTIVKVDLTGNVTFQESSKEVRKHVGWTHGDRDFQVEGSAETLKQTFEDEQGD